METGEEAAVSVAIARPGLYLVATPIGNLGDISLRALALLRAVDLILAEDTRTSLRLLDRYSIRKPLEALHQHNEGARAEALVTRIQQDNLAVALISDAGTPLLSDPDFPLVRAALAAGLMVTALPGASALLCALTLSGLPAERFVFEGFLPPKTAARRAALEALVHEPRTMVFHESAHRIAATLDDLLAVMGPTRQLAIARELTKLHETVYRGSIAEVHARMAADPHATRGEFVVVLEGADEVPDAELPSRLLAALRGRLSARDAVEVVHEVTGYPRNQLYKMSLGAES